MTSSATMADPEPIAIIGMGCRFPGNVGSPEDLWRLLSEGGSGWGLVPAGRWNADAFYHPDATAIQAYNTKSGYFLKHDVADFDSRFFGFGSHEADVTDPQQRILLETTYEALENAGLHIENLRGSDTAVFAALFARDYDRMGYKNLETLSKFHIGGTGEAIIANRISHFFDFRGISMTIDTGCSGSLVALHEACIALRTGQSRMAIVGGTEIILHPDQNVSMSSGGMLNSEGKCFTFDSRGAGYGRGEGVASVVVKRLNDALRDGDTVHAVIRNSGANQDGKTTGVTLPNPDAQEAVIRAVYAAAGLDPHETPYIEAHGTGTQVGDQAEIQSLGNVFGGKKRARHVYVGSVKTNIGHLEAASGIAGLIKAVLVLKKQLIPPNLNFIEPKPGLRLEERQISVPLELLPLVPEGETPPLRVSLNSFGYGGTNCHMILESLEQFISGKGSSSTNGAANIANAPNGANGIDKTQQDGVALVTGMPLIFPLSASSEAALDAMPDQIRKWVAGRDAPTDSDLRDLSYTLACRRSLFKWRKAFVARDLARLTAALDESKLTKIRAAPRANIAFVFTGQGAQWAGMGSELIAASQTFKKSIQKSAGILKSLGCEWDLAQELIKPVAESRINESSVAQPTTTILQMALVDTLLEYGVRPKSVVGHSSGEIAAAYAVGALTREGAVMCSFFRGRYSSVAKKLNALPGSMLATGYGEQSALQTIKAANLDSEKGRVTVACINSPASTTLSGDEPAIDYIQEMLVSGGVFARKLKVETAYHSHHMEKVAASYSESLQGLASLEAPEGTFYSSVTGGAKTSGFGPAYWVDNLVSQVRFNDAMTALVQNMADTGSHDDAIVLIEIGPHPALQGPINQILSTMPGFKSAYVAPLSRGKNSAEAVSAAVARLFELGAKVDFKGLFTAHHQPRPQVIDDLPPYPWDHRVKHWAESRLSRDHRLRRFPYHDLLGVYDVMSPIDEPRWRHHINVQRLPWLKDHVVDGMIIFPGAGYSTMGVEAMKQLFQMQNHQEGVRIASTIMKDVRIARPIILPVESVTDGPGGDIEVQLILSPSKLSEHSPWYSVRILSLQPDQTWAEHVSGMIRVELDSSTAAAPKPEAADIFLGEEHKAPIHDAFEALERIQSLAQEKMDMVTFYDDRRAAGNDWGASFALLTEAYIGPGVGFSKLNIPDVGQWMPFGYFQPHLIHPTTLDASNHMLPAIFHREITKAPLMPVTTEESVFYGHISSKPGDEMLVAMELKPEGKSVARGNVWAFQHDFATGKLMLVSSVRGLLMRAVGEEASPASSRRPFDRKHNYQVYWNDDPDFHTNSSFARLVGPHVAKGSTFLEQLSVTEKATAIYLGDVKDMPMIQAPETAPLPHLCEFSRWIFDAAHASSDVCAAVSDDERAETLHKSSSSGIEGEMLGRIGRNLAAILTNTVKPLELLVADNLLERFYKEGPFKPLYMQMVQYMRLLTNKNPEMDVLEIGAGTGSATLPLFEAMGDDAPDLIHSYTYTDISSGFFETAKDRLDRWDSVIAYKTLDISRDPVEQGFGAGSFDLVVASNVLHATRSMRETMTHVRKLLKPGGRLLLVEVNRSTAVVSRILGTIFGTLPGWWEFADGRKDSPLLTNGEWHEVLMETSFGGIEFASPDCDGPLARTSFIVSKAIEVGNVSQQAEPKPALDSVSVIYNLASPVGRSAGDALSSSFREQKISSAGYTWDTLPTLEQQEGPGATMYVVLDSANSTVLQNPGADLFARFQNLLVNCRNILWITFQEEGGPQIGPIKALVSGLARVVRRENEGIRFITVEVRDTVTSHRDDVTRLVQEVLRVSQLLLSSDSGHSVRDDEEFALSGDRLLIPRVYADKKFNQWTDLVNGRGHLSPQPFKDPKRPLRMEMGAPGLLSSIHFVPDTAPSTPLGSEEIQIDSKAFGINFRDVFVALGQLSLATFMGECAGVVTAVGSGEFVQATYKIGDRVVGMHAQPFASYSRLSGYEAHVLPDNISFAEASSIQVVYTTVYYSLVHVARLEPGQTVLIHAGSGGVGQAAIQLARHLGADVFVSVGSEEKRQFLMSDYGIPESHILSSRATPSDFKRRLMRLTANRGVDVVLNSTSGEMLAESWDCVASFGYHIELGKSDIDKGRHISMAPFKRNVTFASVDLVVISRERPKLFYHVLDKVLALFSQGVLKPVHPLNIFPIDRLESAFRLISERKHLGKVVLDVGHDDGTVQAKLTSPPPVQLKSDGTYIIAGGLGDIGRMLVKHLASRGAGHIVTLSRRKLGDEERIAWEAEVEKSGARLHVLQCDITDDQSVQKTAEFCRQSLPPVHGLFHAGMVLKDRPLVKMTPEEWNSVLAPKVFGTLNLDKAFSSPDLDFFVTLASLAGTLGNPGQSNYSAANAFQDSFVTHHERIHPTRYVSVDLPLVDETSAINAMKAENRDFVGKGSILFDVQELLQLMDYAMDPAVELDRPFLHSLMGFDRQSMKIGSGDYVWAAMFRTIPRLPVSDPHSHGHSATKRDVEGLLRRAATLEEAVEVILETTIEKFVAFLNLEADDIGPQQALSSFGLDSLVSIELKNWMVRTFKVALQASELTSAPSITHLAETLASRSKLLPANLTKQGQTQEESSREEESDDSKKHTRANTAVASQVGTGVKSLECCALPDEEARQPVPNLDEAMQNHIRNIAHFALSDDEVENLRVAVRELNSTGSTGREVYQAIQKDARDPKVTNWVSKHLAEDFHLRMRQPLQYTNFMAIHHPSPVPHTQAERAALLATTAFQFKKDIDSGTVEALFIMDTPICKAPLKWLFNTYRQPQTGMDEIIKGAGNYCAVFRRGRLFQVPLQDGEAPASFEALRSAMAAILEHVQDEGTWVGILTSDNRDSWAKIRDELLAASPANAHYFQTIEAAAFAINLDDGSPVGYADLAKQGKLGDGFNRWNDKPLQFVVTANGNSGVLVEHSHLDGTTPAPLYDRVRDAIATYKPSAAQQQQQPPEEGALTPQEIPLVLPASLDAHIATLRDRWREASASRDFVSHELRTLGAHLLGQNKFPIKGGYDILCQLALYLYNGRRVTPNWTPVMLAHFHEGRHDMVQLVSEPVRAFCEAAAAVLGGEGDEQQRRKCRALMLEAARDVSRRVTEAKEGRGFYRLFTVMEQQWPAGVPKAAVFDDALLKRGMDFTAVTNINHTSVESVTTPLDPSVLRLRYTIRDDHSLISLNCPVGTAEKLVESVEEAAMIIRNLSLAT